MSAEDYISPSEDEYYDEMQEQTNELNFEDDDFLHEDFLEDEDEDY